MKSQKQTLSMYIHIPFCQKKCAYCDFLSFDCKNHQIVDYLKVLNLEIATWEKRDKYIVKSIFFGGGTPSILSGQQIINLMACIQNNYELIDDCEITMECNPGTLTEDKVKNIKESGINRISMGVQSLDMDTLKSLGRIHSDTEFYNQYQLLRHYGFNNINLDIMYALPHQTLEHFKEQLKKVITLAPEHLSVYGLIIEADTPYEMLYNRQPDIFPDEEVERQMYWLAHDILTKAGYEHYEISNYAKAGLRCKHNEVYWLLEPYIGFGLGASSYIDDSRFDQTRDIDQYILANGHYDAIKIIRNNDALKEELVFLGLRRLEGVNKAYFKEKTGESLEDVYGQIIKELVEQELLIEDKGHIKLTGRGIDISNHVMSKFIL